MGNYSSQRDFIDEQRTRIDELDARLIELIKIRKGVSNGIQQHRVETKGPRSDTARENKVLKKYSSELGGEQGTALAMEVLKICRL
jgi:monofunctional chorismate mutase